MSSPRENPPPSSRPIADYALIGDTHTTALVASDGRIDWLCWPRHDSPALLTRLLDEQRGGCCAIELQDLASAGRAYEDNTNILETQFAGSGGRAVLSDFMPVHPPETEADAGPDGEVQSRLLRLVTSTQGRVRGRWSLHVTPDYGRGRVSFEQVGAGCLEISAEGLLLRVTTSGTLTIDGERILAAFDLVAGEHAFFAVTYVGDSEIAPLLSLRDAQTNLERTRRYWTTWSKQIHYDGRYRASVVRSALVLKLLTFSPTGAIVAAPTTSLPEAVPGPRNYDYRFSWVRDASFTVTAFCNLGLKREAAEYLRFLREADGTRGRDLTLLYGIAGPVPPETELPNLPGWNNVGPVRVGNAARTQKQYDIYGEFTVALHAYLTAVGDDVPDWIRQGLPELIANLAENALRFRSERDNGIWELRLAPQHLQHTKALLWVALDRAASMAETLGSFEAATLDRWRIAAKELRAEYEAKSWNEGRGAYMQAYGSDVLDAAVLRTILFDALDPRDPRTISTLHAVVSELGDGDLIYRYRADDGLEGDEGTFTACAFWRVGALALGGRPDEAQVLFERLLARSNDLGLFAEEIDAASGEQRGNFPQGFTHMCVINHAIRLEDAIRAASDGPGLDRQSCDG